MMITRWPVWGPTMAKSGIHMLAAPTLKTTIRNKIWNERETEKKKKRERKGKNIGRRRKRGRKEEEGELELADPTGRCRSAARLCFV
jgi:hypothetical protein